MQQTRWFELPLPGKKTMDFVDRYGPFNTVRQLIHNINQANRRILEIQTQQHNDIRNMKIWKMKQGRG